VTCRGRKRAAPAALLAGAVLALAVVWPAASASAKPPTVDAVVVGKADGPVFSELRRQLGKRLRLVTGNRLRRAHGDRLEGFEAVIVDGDHLSPRQLRRHGLISRANAAGLWIVAFDTGRRHRHAGLSRHTGFRGFSGGRSYVYMFRRHRVGGTVSVPILETRRLKPSGYGRRSRKAQRDHRRLHTRRVASAVAQRLGQLADGDQPRARRSASAGDTVCAAPEGGARASAAAGGEATTVPINALHYQICYAPDFPEGTHKIAEAARWGPKDILWDQNYGPHGPQTASWVVEHIWDVFLQNSVASPQGSNQLISYRLNAQFSPKKPNESFIHMDDHTNWFGIDRYPERSWWTSKWEVKLEPDTDSNKFLLWKHDSPDNENKTSHISVGDNFDIGFSASAGKDGPEIGVDASYGWHYERDYDVSSWEVENTGSGNSRHWVWHSADPCDTTQSLDKQQPDQARCFDQQFAHDGAPIRPNNLSLGTLKVGATARWITDKVRDANVTFTVDTPIELIGTYGNTIFITSPFGCCFYFIDRWGKTQTVGPPKTKQTIDLGAVIPVDYSMSVPDKVEVTTAKSKKTQVNGTIKLAKPAPWDLVIEVFGESPVAQPKSNVVTIPKGKTEAQFPILINGDQISKKNDLRNANVGAFYTTVDRETITVKLSD
jgi:hypothetical protein